MSILYIDEQGVHLKRKRELIVFEKEKQVIKEIPIAVIDTIVIAGNIQISTQTLALLFEKEIPVSFISVFGNFKGKLTPSTNKNAYIRLNQYQKYNDEQFKLKLSKAIIKAKIKNAKTFLQKHQRNYKEIEIDKELEDFETSIQALDSVKDLEEVNGIEGFAAKQYFKSYGKFFKKEFIFEKRTKRPPLDPINALLSLGYTLLFNELYTAIEITGMDPYIGFLHSIEYGRPSLASDLVEEFRFLIDGLALSLINKEVLTGEDFTKEENGGIYLNEKGRENFYQQYEKKILTELQYNDMTLNYRKIFFHQAEQLAKVINGKKENYEGFETK